MDVTAAATTPAEQVLHAVGTTVGGLTEAEAARRLTAAGPNAVRTHHARLLPVLARQLRSPLLLLLAVTAAASYFVGERSDAVIIGIILAASVGLGFGNEYRAEKAAEALHSQLRHHCVTRRDGHAVRLMSPTWSAGMSSSCSSAPWYPPTPGCWPPSAWNAMNRC